MRYLSALPVFSVASVTGVLDPVLRAVIEPDDNALGRYSVWD